MVYDRNIQISAKSDTFTKRNILEKKYLGSLWNTHTYTHMCVYLSPDLPEIGNLIISIRNICAYFWVYF